MIVAVTGHRPPKLGGYSMKAAQKLKEFAVTVLDFYKPDKIITGMSLGWDTAIADACCQTTTPFISAVPFHGFESKWPDASKEIFYKLLECAEEVVYVTDTDDYKPEYIMLRNIWMVDHADWILALWNGSDGGTMNTIKFAEKRDKEIINVWEAWEIFNNND